MFLSHDFEDTILYEPARKDGLACDTLNIVTGFTDCDMIAQHIIQLHDEQGNRGRFMPHIQVNMLLGMYKGAGITQNKHTKIMQTLNRINNIDSKKIHMTCRYVYCNAQVHSKAYVWLKDNKPVKAFMGSANYSVNAFRIRREIMTDCDAEAVMKYFQEIYEDTKDCFDKDVVQYLHFSKSSTQEEELSPFNIENLSYEALDKKPPLDVLEVSWLTSDGKVGETSGPNWGIRHKDGYISQNGVYTPYNRDPNQAYIPYNKYQQKPGFFPDRKHPDDKNCPLFKAVTKDDGIFYMRMAQQGNKGLQTAESNAILGKWLRKKLSLPDGAVVKLSDFKKYRRTSVKFRKYADDVFLMDF